MCGAEVKSLPEGVQRVAALLQASGHAHAPVMLDDAARTAQQAVNAGEEKQGLQHAITLVTLRAQTLHSAADVPSPCISICRMSATTELCEGCFRTRSEIAGWSSADDDSKRALWRVVEQRMQA